MSIRYTFTPSELITVLEKHLLHIECLLEQGQVFPDHGEVDDSIIINQHHNMSGRGWSMNRLPFAIVRDIIMIMGQERVDVVDNIVTVNQLRPILDAAQSYLEELLIIRDTVREDETPYRRFCPSTLKKKFQRGPRGKFSRQQGFKPKIISRAA